MTMRRIGSVVDFTARLEDIGAARKRFRAERIAACGWNPSVSCVMCGDTGGIPDEGDRPCYCARGEVLARQNQREAEWEAICPRRFRGLYLDTHPSGPNSPLVQSIMDWIRNGYKRGQNLVLYGPVGTGKTGLAVTAAQDLFMSCGASVRIGTVPDLMDAMRPNPKQDIPDIGMQDLQRVRLLVMDDLGTEKASEWVGQQLYALINGRYERELPTIVTTNRTIPDLRDAIGERAISRLTEDAALVHVGGADLRRNP